ncbi:MAG: hypothetical protein A2Z75_08625 [Chloroflexi bacterium RBG_13_50_10]|nr:MAG: hypothetical protein A2Z75_08625 [Chloroflexi bacterium RBG_13_50_10]
MSSSSNKPKPKMKAISKSLKTAVWDRYIGATNAEGKCYVCKRTIHITDFDCGHNKARAKGGTDNISNLRPICRQCNLSMRTKSIEAFKKPFGKAKRTKRGMKKTFTVHDSVRTHLTKKVSEQEARGIDFGDGVKLTEKSLELEVGRGETEETVELDYSLPLNIDYAHAINLDLANKEKVKTSAKLKWIPFFRVSYKVNCKYSDPGKTSHPITDDGVYIVNAYTKTIVEEEETLIFTKELEKTPAENQYYEQTGEYQVIKLPQRMTKGEARALATDYVIQKHTEPIWYDVPSAKKKRKGDLDFFDEPERKKWTLKPLKKDVRVLGDPQIVYAPKWEIDFDSKDYKYYKSLSGNTGTVFVDNVTYCSMQSHEGFFGSRKKNVAVCDVCGQFLCQEHIFKCPTCSSWLCEKDSIQCAGCKKRFCADHIKNKCFKCSVAICDNCALKCIMCGEIYCNAHMTKCSRCGKSVCVSCTRREGGLFKKTVCKNC